MGWENYHLHEFEQTGQRYGIPSSEYDEPDEVIPEGRVRLEDVLSASQPCLLYTYDFGDNWHHSIQLESVHSPEQGVEYPRVVEGRRSCPPEGCGSTLGYANLLEILLDPEHEEFEQMREWAGESFNAEVFSVDAVNKRLSRNRSLTVMQ